MPNESVKDLPLSRPPPRVCVLGVGAMGRLHARVFAGLPGHFVLAGVYDPDLDAAQGVASRWEVPAFRGETEAILAADLVVVASPIEAHAGSARRALAQGRDVLVEKPVCATAPEAAILLRSVGRGQQLFVGHSERWNPVIRALRALVRPRDIRTLRLLRTSAPARRGSEHGALVSLGVHDLDLIAHLTASTVRLRQVVHVEEDRAELVLAAATGALAWLEVDRGARVRQRTIELGTTDAFYRGDMLAKSLVVQRPAGGPEVPCVLEEAEPLVEQALSIARALAGSREPVATGTDGARALMLALEASAGSRLRAVANLAGFGRAW